jgi:hypothetical protein
VRDEANSFTYDHVTTEYGPGAGMMFVTDTFAKVKNAFKKSDANPL